MKALAISLLLLTILGLPHYSASAFGPIGHKIVATIAMQYLSSSTRQNVQRTLGNITPEDAATWMDNMRDDPSYDYMKPWHFINIDKGQPYKPGTNNIIWELERVYAELQHPEKLSKKARQEDLMILFHLMGDLHQPLHVGYGKDRGGNSVAVTIKDFATDLHRIWDSEIIWNQHITAEACLKLSNITAKDILQAGFAPAQFVDFMKDSRNGLPTVYSFSGGNIDQSYINKNKMVVMSQLQHAGMRLAVVLQRLFGTPVSAAKSAQPGATIKSIDAMPNETVIAPEEAGAHLGESVTVCGKVSGSNVNERSDATHIKFGGNDSKSPLTLVIISDDLGNFSYNPKVFLNGNTVCVKGFVRSRKGKAEIVVSDEGQIQIR